MAGNAEEIGARGADGLSGANTSCELQEGFLDEFIGEVGLAMAAGKVGAEVFAAFAEDGLKVDCVWFAWFHWQGPEPPGPHYIRVGEGMKSSLET